MEAEAWTAEILRRPEYPSFTGKTKALALALRSVNARHAMPLGKHDTRSDICHYVPSLKKSLKPYAKERASFVYEGPWTVRIRYP
jgi:hypothetical protein